MTKTELEIEYIKVFEENQNLKEALIDVLNSVGALTNISEFPNVLNISEERGREILELLK